MRKIVIRKCDAFLLSTQVVRRMTSQMYTSIFFMLSYNCTSTVQYCTVRFLWCFRKVSDGCHKKNILSSTGTVRYGTVQLKISNVPVRYIQYLYNCKYCRNIILWKKSTLPKILQSTCVKNVSLDRYRYR